MAHGCLAVCVADLEGPLCESKLPRDNRDNLDVALDVALDFLLLRHIAESALQAAGGAAQPPSCSRRCRRLMRC